MDREQEIAGGMAGDGEGIEYKIKGGEDEEWEQCMT